MLSEKHQDENLQDNVDGKISASERRILLTKWCGEACANNINHDSVIRGFKKCGLSINLDGSENHERG